MKLEIWQDTGCDPREDWDNLGTLALVTHDGDETIKDPINWLAEMLDLEAYQVRGIADKLGVSYYTDEVKECLQAKFFDRYIALPVYKYEHSRVAYNTTGFRCRWDSGQVGYIYVTKEDAKNNWGLKRLSPQKRQWALDILKSEVETFSQWANGEIYGFTVEDEEKGISDSCGGFYGSDWENNGILDHIDYKGLGLTKEQMLERLEETEVSY